MIPSLFLAHGSPMLAIEDTDYTDFLAEVGQQIKPKAIVLFTAHWETETLTLSSIDGTYETIYDFGGFPDELYQIQYPAPGSPVLANRLQTLFNKEGIATLLDTTRGLDHGSWTLLHRMYPQADIPVVQISVHPYLPPAEQYRIGQVLQQLGQEDILVIGSGVTVHNLRMVKWGQEAAEPWAVEFDDWLIDKMNQDDREALFQYATLAPHAKQAVPRPEHFVPFFIAMGSGISKPEIIFRGYQFGTLSYLCMKF